MPSSKKANFIAKHDIDPTVIRACESVLAEGLRGFLSELVMVDGGVMVSYICNKQHAHIEDIIVSSTECAMKPGRLHYSNHAHVDFDWGKAPSVALKMELRDPKLTAFFEVVLGESHVGVDISGIQFADRLGDPAENIRRFADAVADARLQPAH